MFVLRKMCDPGMRIWSVSNQSVFPPYALFAAVGIVAAIVLAAKFLFLRKKRQ
jgi:hypothetical protein